MNERMTSKISDIRLLTKSKKEVVMKTLKLMLAAIFVAFAMSSMAGIDPSPKAVKTVKITFQKAVHNPMLVKAMYVQIDPNKLISNSHYYTARVEYRGVNYLITGTCNQWKRFFKLGVKPPVTLKTMKLISE
jgi:hypothetical protein